MISLEDCPAPASHRTATGNHRNMCGIVGLVYKDPSRPCEACDHRRDARRRRPIAAPMMPALYLDGPVGLGHRRLSIIDLGGGHQPMADAQRALLDRLQRRDLQLPASLREELRRQGLRVPHAQRHRGHPPALRRPRRDVRRRAERHVRVRDLGRGAPHAVPRARSHGRQAALLRRDAGGVRVRLGDQVALRQRARSPPRAARRRSPSTCFPAGRPAPRRCSAA